MARDRRKAWQKQTNWGAVITAAGGVLRAAVKAAGREEWLPVVDALIVLGLAVVGKGVADRLSRVSED